MKEEKLKEQIEDLKAQMKAKKRALAVIEAEKRAKQAFKNEEGRILFQDNYTQDPNAATISIFVTKKASDLIVFHLTMGETDDLYRHLKTALEYDD